jgi:hypothetical protein
MEVRGIILEQCQRYSILSRSKEQLGVVVMSAGPGEIRKYYREQMSASVYGVIG